MVQAPKKCTACGQPGRSVVWNDLEILRCSECGLAWRAAFDIEADYYVGLHAGEEGVGEGKATARLRNARDRLGMIKAFLPQEGVCDIGCGDGSFLEALKEQGYRKLWGIEPSDFARSIAREKGFDVTHEDVFGLLRLQQGRTLHALTLFHVIEHIANPRALLELFKNALPRGGILVIETPDADAAVQKVTNHRNALVYREHLFYWTKDSLSRILQQNGFRVVRVSHRSFDWKYASISSSLMRLGLMSDHSQAGQPADTVNTLQKVRSGGRKESGMNLIRSFIRTALASLVHLLKRDDYILLVAERE